MSGQELKVGEVVSVKQKPNNHWSCFPIRTKSALNHILKNPELLDCVKGIHPTLRDPELARMAAEIERLNAEVELLRAIIRPIANSHTDNEGTDKPVWWILDPEQMMSPSFSRIYNMFYGPFWSREYANKFFTSTRHRYGAKAGVYSGSANSSEHMKELYQASAMLAASPSPVQE